MNQQEIIDQIKSLLNSSEKAIIEIQNGTNIDFYITLIQQNNIDCFNLSKRIQSTKVSESNIASKLEIQKPHEPITVQVETVVETQIPDIEPVSIVEPITEPILEPIVEPILEPIAEPIKGAEKTEAPIQEPIAQIEVETFAEPDQESMIEEAVKTPLKTTPSIQTSKFKEEETDEFSVNSKISKNKQPVLNFADKSTETSISDLAKAISIGKKFEFINGLFDGNSEAYKNCIHTIQSAENYPSAINYIENEINNQFDWNEHEQLAAEFFALIKRRFN